MLVLVDDGRRRPGGTERGRAGPAPGARGRRERRTHRRGRGPAGRCGSGRVTGADGIDLISEVVEVLPAPDPDQVQPMTTDRPNPHRCPLVNLPNALTVLRLILVPVFLLALFAEGGHDTTWRWIAWIVDGDAVSGCQVPGAAVPGAVLGAGVPGAVPGVGVPGAVPGVEVPGCRVPGASVKVVCSLRGQSGPSSASDRSPSARQWPSRSRLQRLRRKRRRAAGFLCSTPA